MSAVLPDVYSPLRRWYSPAFDALSFFVSHLFLYPLPLLIYALYLIFWGSAYARAVSLSLLVAYAFSMSDKAQFTGKRTWPGFRSIWMGCHSYFPVVTKMWDGTGYPSSPTEGHARVFDLERQTFVFGLHPHGPLPVGGAVLPVQLTRWPAISERLRVGVASAVFWCPLVRDFYLWFGGVDAGRKTLERMLREGHSVMVLPGGIHEQLWVCEPGEDVVVLRSRKGFVRLALSTGSPLVPVFVFGERRAYRANALVSKLISRVLKRLCNIGMPLVLGRWCTLMPFPGRITIVFGAPIDVGGRVPDPPAAAVDELHARYCAALEALYDEHKAEAGYADVKLRIK